jgi:hypothetical protein
MLQFTVELRAPRYVMLGGSALLHCEYSVGLEQLHRVEWLRNDKKLFQFVKGRTPPFRNFTTPGAELDVSSFGLLFRSNLTGIPASYQKI